MKGAAQSNKSKKPWDTEFKDKYTHLCMLFPIYKKTTANSENCKICKMKGCNQKSAPDPSVGGASNMCEFHFKWYNRMYDFLVKVEKECKTSRG